LKILCSVYESRINNQRYRGNSKPSLGYIGGEVGVGSSGDAVVGVGSTGRGVSVGGEEVGLAVGGTWVALGRSVGGASVGRELGLLVGVRVAVAKRLGCPEIGVRINLVGVCKTRSIVCVASTGISGVRDRAAALILLLK
jgi:hypothetical protein